MAKLINLSYVIVTRNKLAYLKPAVERLLPTIQADEELIVVDGGSTDGTAEYIGNLYAAGRVDFFVSEPDKGEAHGCNKGLMLARGELVKLISDDDVFYHPGIKSCKQHMLEHPELDVIMGNTASLYQADHITFVKGYQVWFEDWLKGNVKNCFFCCLPLMIRKSSLPYLGLFSPQFAHGDLEYSVRITSLGAKIAWSTAILVVAVQNQQSNSVTRAYKATQEVERVSKFYDFKYLIGKVKDEDPKGGMATVATLLARKIRTPKVHRYPDLNVHYKRNPIEPDGKLSPIELLFKECDRFLEKFNSENENVFLTNLP